MGKFLVILLVLSTAIAGGTIYYLQIYGYYFEVVATPGKDVKLMPKDGTAPVAIAYTDFEAIDADSSPIRYRGCFKTNLKLEDLKQEYSASAKVEPRTAPDWFTCFDAQKIGAALEEGRAIAFLSAKNVGFGVDRVVAITDQGDGYIWHEFNDCGEKAYDGTVVGEECPQRPEN